MLQAQCCIYTRTPTHTQTNAQREKGETEDRLQTTGPKQNRNGWSTVTGGLWQIQSSSTHLHVKEWGFCRCIGDFLLLFLFFKRKKFRKDVTPHTVYTFYWQDVKRKEVTESNRCLVMSSIQAPNYGKLDVSLSLGIFQMQLITNKQYLTNVALRGVQFGSLGSLPVCYSSYHGCLPHSHLLPHLQKLHAV